MSIIDGRTDAIGTSHPRARPDARIISLVPSITELLCDLGLQHQIVGRTGFCIHPRPVVREIPKVGGTKDVNVDKLRELAPSHVIVNIDENTRELVDEISGFIDNIVVTHPLGPEDNLGLFEMMGFLFSRVQEAASLARRFRDALNRLHTAFDRPPVNVLYLIWRDPWMSISSDTYISRMLKLVNWDSLPQSPHARYPSVDLKDFVGVVDKVLLSSEPYPFRAKHIAEISELFDRQVEVKLVDGEMLSWYGSRAIAGLDYLKDFAANTNRNTTA
jgi:ABC-type Fe3+-hydroxamate transport system substrate-binding protein